MVIRKIKINKKGGGRKGGHEEGQKKKKEGVNSPHAFREVSCNPLTIGRGQERGRRTTTRTQSLQKGKEGENPLAVHQRAIAIYNAG